MIIPPLPDPIGWNRPFAGRPTTLCPQYTIMLRAGQSYSAAACLALTDGDAAMRVLRCERGPRVVQDLVLGGSTVSRPKWVGHWLIRLAALQAGIGLTTALILDGDLPSERVHHAAMLEREGAWVHQSSAMFPEETVLQDPDILSFDAKGGLVF